jgi:hypothetical protein
MASAPMARIKPETEKNHLDAPMKSKFQRIPSPWAPSAWRERSSRVRPSEPRMAEVASTAVNSETSVPTPRVSAKPLTPPVAMMNRMKATPTVTTLASAIVRSALP